MRLRLAMNDLMSVLLKGRPLSQLARARRVLYLVFVHVVLYGLEVYCELGVVWQCLILGIVFVQIEIIIVRYVRIRFDRGDIAGRTQFAADDVLAKTIEFCIRKSRIVGTADNATSTGSITAIITAVATTTAITART